MTDGGIFGRALVCPVCGAPLAERMKEEAPAGAPPTEGGSLSTPVDRQMSTADGQTPAKLAALVCAAGHAFDAASSGYVNLLDPGRARNAKAGDDREMVRARSAFLSRGFYSPVADAASELIATAPGHTPPLALPRVVADLGCGEGYYTNALASSCPSCAVLGFDASKHAADSAAKAARRAGLRNVRYVAANIFRLPLADGCAGAALSLFAPVPFDEARRILAPGGSLVVGAAGERHLYELKEAIYASVYENAPRADVPDGFEAAGAHEVRYTVHLPDADAVRSLFAMTPYSWRTPKDARARLDAIASLDVTVDVAFSVFIRK
jgi:23S rRNA (guanine745-N1)-methyltransferase